jgi:hypothetical protein
MWILEFVVVVSLASGPAHAAQEIGVDRSQLGSQSEAVQVKTLDDIKSLHATWFRDGPTSGSPQGVANFVAEVKRVKQRNLNVGQYSSDG